MGVLVCECVGDLGVNVDNILLVRQPSRHFTLTLQKYPQNQVIADFDSPFAAPMCSIVNLRMLLSTRFFGGFTIPWGP